MSISPDPLANAKRLLFAIALRPIQGHRFQPTGFPGLGHATFQTSAGTSLLVESTQSMANRLEAVCWDEAVQRPVEDLDGISHVTVTRKGQFFTDTLLEAHRLNSPYLLEGKNKGFVQKLKSELVELGEGPVDRRKLAQTVLKYDVNGLLHGLFLAKKDLAGGRLRVTRALSAFIEADAVRVAPAGGVKNDHVNPSGDTTSGFGNVPFARDEYTAERITLYVNLDLALLRGYGLEKQVEEMLVLLALYKIRALLVRGLRLRTACDLVPVEDAIHADSPRGFSLPDKDSITPDLKAAIGRCRGSMVHETVPYEDELRKGKERQNEDAADEEEDTTDSEAEGD